ncbi:TPA: hypothetical protein ACHB1L_001113 [Klebsiella pneumoniae]|nr:hypothetical protein [Klebsiella pneumoniae]
MTNNQLNRERLEKIKSWRETYGAGSNVMLPAEEAEELARIALAAMDSEPVAYAWVSRSGKKNLTRCEPEQWRDAVILTPLYRHAQPAQISEPVLPLQDKDLQGVIDALEHPAGINAAGKQVVRHALVEIQERRKADSEPVAEVVSIYGDPEAFGEREIRPLVGIQQMPYGTKLYRHVQPAPVVPDDVLAALQKVARIRLDLNDFDGDRRGIADCLGDAEEALIEVVNRRADMLHAGNSPANPDCWCRACRPVTLNDMRFVVCPDCGNKRCPRANDHRNACTGSNEPGQEGSAYPDTPREVK